METTSQLADDRPISDRPTILLVEEDTDAHRVLKRKLRHDGYRVLATLDLEDALEWMRDVYIPADLLLINLLGKSPDEALEIGRRLREHARYDGHTPLVVLPERISEKLAGRDVEVSKNDWVCYYEDGEQIATLLARLTNRPGSGDSGSGSGEHERVM